jgi:hypothetical protein
MMIMNSSQLIHKIATVFGRPDLAHSVGGRARVLLALESWVARDGQDHAGLLRDIRANRDYPAGVHGRALVANVNAADSDSTPLSDGDFRHSPDTI